ncbi:outer membrane protein [Desulfobaculum xiamenense]|uniref:Outer membrane protein n=1 Tax=Desulfobaculum xiamenense TaxID=995050 RepID=A0A846QU13_9BACT|nr:TolC family protein [Desulfobaculum xiamenense]NJB68965.1 outer membrane protein [Desulfobaculum xiamenense]
MRIPRLKTIIAVALLAAFAAVPAMAETTVYNMEQAVVRALEANPSIIAARHDLAGSEEGRKSARGAFLPSAKATYGYTAKDHAKPKPQSATSEADLFSAGVNVHQNIFTGWNTLSTYQKSVLGKERSQATLRSAELTLVGLVQQNFLGLLQARENVRVAEDSLKRLQEQLKVTRAFYDVGLKPRLDVLQAEVDLARAEDTLLSARNSVSTQMARLNTLLGLELDADADYAGSLDYVPFSAGIDDVLARAYKARPDLEIAGKSVEIALKDETIAKSGYYPQVGADFDWSTYGDDMTASGSDLVKTEFSEWSVGVSASWTLWEWGKTHYAVKQAKESVKSLIASADNTRQEATYEVKANHLDIGKAAESIKVNRKAVEAAQEGYRMAVARYQAQVGTNTDVLDAQERLTTAEAGLIKALADYRIALSKMFVSMGEQNPALDSF